MGFHGQDNAFGQSLGANPNHFMEPGNSKDTPTLYIENLQQQIHFMELELKILKEKVLALVVKLASNKHLTRTHY